MSNNFKSQAKYLDVVLNQILGKYMLTINIKANKGQKSMPIGKKHCHSTKSQANYLPVNIVSKRVNRKAHQKAYATKNYTLFSSNLGQILGKLAVRKKKRHKKLTKGIKNDRFYGVEKAEK